LLRLRNWLRKLIGWAEVGAALQAQRDYLVSLENLIAAQGKEIQALKFQRAQREQKRSQITDWEQQMAEYASNPENFKEN
jgi:hypothetical protein